MPIIVPQSKTPGNQQQAQQPELKLPLANESIAIRLASTYRGGRVEPLPILRSAEPELFELLKKQNLGIELTHRSSLGSLTINEYRIYRTNDESQKVFPPLRIAGGSSAEIVAERNAALKELLSASSPADRAKTETISTPQRSPAEFQLRQSEMPLLFAKLREIRSKGLRTELKERGTTGGKTEVFWEIFDPKQAYVFNNTTHYGLSAGQAVPLKLGPNNEFHSAEAEQQLLEGLNKAHASTPQHQIIELENKLKEAVVTNDVASIVKISAKLSLEECGLAQDIRCALALSQLYSNLCGEKLQGFKKLNVPLLNALTEFESMHPGLLKELQAEPLKLKAFLSSIVEEQEAAREALKSRPIISKDTRFSVFVGNDPGWPEDLFRLLPHSCHIILNKENWWYRQGIGSLKTEDKAAKQALKNEILERFSSLLDQPEQRDFCWLSMHGLCQPTFAILSGNAAIAEDILTPKELAQAWVDVLKEDKLNLENKTLLFEFCFGQHFRQEFVSELESACRNKFGPEISKTMKLPLCICAGERGAHSWMHMRSPILSADGRSVYASRHFLSTTLQEIFKSNVAQRDRRSDIFTHPLTVEDFFTADDMLSRQFIRVVEARRNFFIPLDDKFIPTTFGQTPSIHGQELLDWQEALGTTIKNANSKLPAESQITAPTPPAKERPSKPRKLGSNSGPSTFADA